MVEKKQEMIPPPSPHTYMLHEMIKRAEGKGKHGTCQGPSTDTQPSAWGTSETQDARTCLCKASTGKQSQATHAHVSPSRLRACLGNLQPVLLPRQPAPPKKKNKYTTKISKATPCQCTLGQTYEDRTKCWTQALGLSENGEDKDRSELSHLSSAHTLRGQTLGPLQTPCSNGGNGAQKHWSCVCRTVTGS